MKITEYFEIDGKRYRAEYEDCDDWSQVPDDLWKQHYGVCFYDGKIIVGLHGVGGSGAHWKIIGGTRESGETATDTLKRELLEEANVDLLEHTPIGYQKTTSDEGETQYQLRTWCRIKPRGPFMSDPDSGVTEIKFIEPSEYKKYFDWGKIGDRIIERAVEIEKGH